MLSRSFLSVKDVADLLKVGEATVRQWIKSKDLRAIDVGREWRVVPTDLEDFLERRATLQRGNASLEAPHAPSARRPSGPSNDRQ